MNVAAAGRLVKFGAAGPAVLSASFLFRLVR